MIFRSMKKCSVALLVCLLFSAPARSQERFDPARLLKDVQVLASDSLEGRRTGTNGSKKARTYLAKALASRGVRRFGPSYEHPFPLSETGSSSKAYGINLLGYIKGVTQPELFLVLTAHYDHLGVEQGKIYNGADDNASGVSGLLAAASYFHHHPPAHSILFAVLDAEEIGLQGARALVKHPPVRPDQMAMNVNLDMIGRNDRNELYAAGVFHYPFLKPFLESIAAGSEIRIIPGHDQPGSSQVKDWTYSSDHAPFHQAHIPFLYFGVEDHADYHESTDDFERIDPGFFKQAVNIIIAALITLDENLTDIARVSRRAQP